MEPENYNNKHFSDEVHKGLNPRLDSVIENEKELLRLLKRILLSAHNQIQKEGFNSLLHLIAKIRLNIEAVNLITPLLKEDYRFKTSINLIYRSLVDDNINLLYLLGFVFPNIEKQISLKNELSILHRDFVESFEVILNAQAKINKLSNTYLKENIFEEIDESFSRSELIKIHPEIFNMNKQKWKTNHEIRETSSPHFSAFYKIQNSKIISASKKIDFIRSSSYPNCDILTSLNKYFTQYFHFSPQMHDIILNDIDFDLKCYWLTNIELLTTLGIANKVLSLDNDFETEINNQLKSFLDKDSNM